MIDDIRTAIRREKQRLLRMRGFKSLEPLEVTGLVLDSAQAEAMLRVEVKSDLDVHLWTSLRDSGDTGLWIDFREHGSREGPWRLEGVAVYFVKTLPPPGWRIINPMDAR